MHARSGSGPISLRCVCGRCARGPRLCAAVCQAVRSCAVARPVPLGAASKAHVAPAAARPRIAARLVPVFPPLLHQPSLMQALSSSHQHTSTPAPTQSMLTPTHAYQAQCPPQTVWRAPLAAARLAGHERAQQMHTDAGQQGRGGRAGGSDRGCATAGTCWTRPPCSGSATLRPCRAAGARAASFSAAFQMATVRFSREVSFKDGLVHLNQPAGHLRLDAEARLSDVRCASCASYLLFSVVW